MHSGFQRYAPGGGLIPSLIVGDGLTGFGGLITAGGSAVGSPDPAPGGGCDSPGAPLTGVTATIDVTASVGG
jgi:hypothetical protein